MEIQILSPTNGQALPLVEWNYEEVKAWIQEGLKKYVGVVYDETQIAQAKADRATLNKLEKALADKRKEMKKKYLQPYEEFEAQCKELETMIKSASGGIDAQVKAYEAFKKQEKLDKIKAELYGPMIGNLAELVPYESLHDPKWLNVTCSMATVSDAMAKKIENIISGLNTIERMEYPADLKEQTKLAFLRTFDLTAATAATDRVIQQREALARREAEMAARREREAAERAERARAAQEAAKYSAPEISRPEPEKPAEVHQEAQSAGEAMHDVSFRVIVTTAQLKALGDFMKANGIKPLRI